MGARFRGAWWVFCLAGLAALTPAKSAGQTIVDVDFGRISFFDPGLYARPVDGYFLSQVMPVYIHRPIDDLTPRAGAEAMAMGGAWLALANGSMALSWNPAGLATMDDVSISADAYVLSGSGSGSALPSRIIIPQYGDFQIENYTSRESPVSAFGFLGAAGPLFDLAGASLVGGVAYRRHTNVSSGEELLLEMGMASTTSGIPFSYGIEGDERGFIESLTFGFGYPLIRNSGFSLAVGSTGNLLTGRVRSTSLERVAVRNFDEGHGWYKQNYRGFAVEAGALATVAEKLRLAAWLGLPNTIRVNNGHVDEQPIITPDNQGIVYRKHWEIADYDLEVPLFASLGAALGPVRGVEVSFDYNFRPWSKAEIRHRDEAFRLFDRSYPGADVKSISLGTRFEFPLFRERLHAMGLRLDAMAGYRTMPLTLLEADTTDIGSGDPQNHGDQVKGHATAMGFALQAGRVSFSVGMEFQAYDLHTWFLNDQSPLGTLEDPMRGLWFEDPNNEVIDVSRTNTIFRFTTEMRL